MKYFLFALLIPLVSFAQELNYNSGTYSKVFQTEKSNEKVYQRAREWIAINFKSANDVLQLDTKEKLIVKGSDRIILSDEYSTINFIGELVLTVSIRDKRFKVDYKMGDTRSLEFPDAEPVPLKNFQFIVEGSMSEREMLDYRLKTFEDLALREGKKEKYINRVKKMIVQNNPEKYKYTQFNKSQFLLKVESTLNNIANYINEDKSKDDW